MPCVLVTSEAFRRTMARAASNDFISVGFQMRSVIVHISLSASHNYCSALSMGALVSSFLMVLKGREGGAG